MSKYRARYCTRCNYFMGFTLTRRFTREGEKTVTSFCLNCSNKLPVLGIVGGVRKKQSPFRRSGLRLVHSSAKASEFNADGDSRRSDMDARINPADYARHLRAIGQDLEVLRLSQFNLEFTGDAYLVWVRPGDQAEINKPLLRIGKNRLQKLWRNRTPARAVGHEEYSDTGRRLRYTVQALDRIERDQRAHRRNPSGSADGHSLSQLLRTVGDLVGKKRERLLGIAWQDLSVGVVIEDPQERKKLDVFRPDNLYDLWVRMYLKRGHRASLDAPH